MKSSSCGFTEQELITCHRKKPSSGARFRGMPWRAEARVRSEIWDAISTDTLGGHFKFPRLPTVELLTLCFLHSSWLFSAASKSQTAQLPAAAVLCLHPSKPKERSAGSWERAPKSYIFTVTPGYRQPTYKDRFKLSLLRNRLWGNAVISFSQDWLRIQAGCSCYTVCSATVLQLQIMLFHSTKWILRLMFIGSPWKTVSSPRCQALENGRAGPFLSILQNSGQPRQYLAPGPTDQEHFVVCSQPGWHTNSSQLKNRNKQHCNRNLGSQKSDYFQ